MILELFNAAAMQNIFTAYCNIRIK